MSVMKGVHAKVRLEAADVLLTRCVLCRAQVEHIVTLRSETVQLQERLKQVEADKAAVEAESDTLRQQVGGRAAAGSGQRT